MRNRQEQQKKIAVFMSGLLLGLSLITGVSTVPAHAEESSTNTSSKKLQNGSFEEGQTWTESYKQPNQSDVPAWNTTATDGKIELFKSNTGSYITGVNLTPTAGTIAAELNAEEESTLYQNVSTSPASVYQWGLDHGARNGTDTMALVIGPTQEVNPSKPSKNGRDQLMQMVDWLIEQGKTSVKTSAGMGEQLTVYSKKFAANGTFENNAGNNAFSLTPSTVYTEEWHIWIMASSRATSGTNPWNSYGSNAVTVSSGDSVSLGDPGSSELDRSKYYLYTVPAGQTETLFGFVSVGYVDSSTTPEKAKTYGNFLDNINFQIFHPLSGSTTLHGSGVVGGSDGTVSGGDADVALGKSYPVTVNDNLITYAVDGKPLKIQAVVKSADAVQGCEFVGLYYTKQDAEGNPVTVFLQKAGNEVEDNGHLSDAEKNGKWVKSTNTDGDTLYTYYLTNLDTATDLHFVFIKSPTVTYDPNGGKPYVVVKIYNTDEEANVYSFKPATGEGIPLTFIPPYVSKAAEGQNDGWKFMGWLLTGDTVSSGDIPAGTQQTNADKLGDLLLRAEHTIACDYTGEVTKKEQYFKIWDGIVATTQNSVSSGEAVTGVKWTANDNTAEIKYANIHKGLTMVAQWRWRQAFIPQVNSSGGYVDSVSGGDVEIISVSGSDANYNATYTTAGGKSYHAETNEIVTAEARAKEGYQFEGWYDAAGNLLTNQKTYSYIETKESVNTCYARFSGQVPQTYVRQLTDTNGVSCSDIYDDNIGILDHYTYSDVSGANASATATAKDHYKFFGWFDSDGNPVADSMVINDGKTISYNITREATYYARFVPAVIQTFQRVIKQGNSCVLTNDDSIGTLSVYKHSDVVEATASSSATAKGGYKFLGWYDRYDENRMIITSHPTISYRTTGDATYYAIFEKKVTQSFVRQVKEGAEEFTTTGDNDIATLSSYEHSDVPGKLAESTANAGNGYEFVGWYDATGNKVAESMLSVDGRTISYTTTGNATYYARFKAIVTQAYNKTLTQAGETFQLMTVIPPEYVSGNDVTWTSDNPVIATVDADGKVTAVRNGTCTITATTADGSYIATFTITVNIPGGVSDRDDDTGSSQADDAPNMDASNQPNETAKRAGTPKTGDESHPALWTVLLLLAIVAMIGTIIYKKKSDK